MFLLGTRIIGSKTQREHGLEICTKGTNAMWTFIANIPLLSLLQACCHLFLLPLPSLFCIQRTQRALIIDQALFLLCELLSPSFCWNPNNKQIQAYCSSFPLRTSPATKQDKTQWNHPQVLPWFSALGFAMESTREGDLELLLSTLRGTHPHSLSLSCLLCVPTPPDLLNRCLYPPLSCATGWMPWPTLAEW